MPGDTTKPRAADVQRLASEAAIGAIQTALPATIVDYDSSTQKATVAVVPCFRRRERGALTCFRPNPIPNVPVVFPSSAGYSLTFPLTAGDPVTLVFSGRSMDEWLLTGEAETEPADPRRFSLIDAIAIPGGRPFVDPLAGVDDSAMVLTGDEIRLGSVSASDFVALSSLVDSNFTAIMNLLVSWSVVPTDGGAALKTAAIALAGTGIPVDTSASKVKAE